MKLWAKGHVLMLKNNGFYLREVAGMSWLLMRGDYPACQNDSTADDLKNGEYVRPVRLNSTGAYIWKQLDEKKEKEEIACNMVKDFGISYNQALTDVDVFLNGLISNNIMRS